MGSDRVLRAIFGAALVAGATYTFAHGLGVTGTPHLVWKGLCVGLIALWCAVQARSVDGWLVAAVMGLCTLGDVLLEGVGMTAGAIAFMAGHAVAIVLYWRNRRSQTSVSQRLLATLLVPLSVVFAAAAVPATAAAGVAVYCLFVAAMAASAWISRFPRYRTGIGAMMFLASDLLIFARMGPLAESALPGLLIWPLYFAGQVLIALGVVRTLTTDARGSTP